MNKKLEHDLNKEKGVVGKMITLFCNNPFIHFLFNSCFPETSAASFCMHCVLPLEPQLLFFLKIRTPSGKKSGWCRP